MSAGRNTSRGCAMLSFTLPSEISSVSSNDIGYRAEARAAILFAARAFPRRKIHSPAQANRSFAREIFSFAIRSPSLNAAASCTAFADQCHESFSARCADVRQGHSESCISPESRHPLRPHSYRCTPVRSRIAISSRFVSASAPRCNSFSRGRSSSGSSRILTDAIANAVYAARIAQTTAASAPIVSAKRWSDSRARDSGNSSSCVRACRKRAAPLAIDSSIAAAAARL